PNEEDPSPPAISSKAIGVKDNPTMVTKQPLTILGKYLMILSTKNERKKMNIPEINIDPYIVGSPSFPAIMIIAGRVIMAAPIIIGSLIPINFPNPTT